jgi:hypothetical protein
MKWYPSIRQVEKGVELKADLQAYLLCFWVKASRPRCWFRQLMTTHNYHD